MRGLSDKLREPGKVLTKVNSLTNLVGSISMTEQGIVGEHTISNYSNGVDRFCESSESMHESESMSLSQIHFEM